MVRGWQKGYIVRVLKGDGVGVDQTGGGIGFEG